MENSAWSDEDIEFLAKEMEDKSRGEIIGAMKEDQYFAPQYDEAAGDKECLAEIDKEVLEVSDRIFDRVIERGVEWVARRLLDGQETEPTYELELMESEAYLAKKWKEEGWSKKDMDDWCFDDSTRALDEIGFVEPSKELSAMNRQLAPALDKLFPKVWNLRDRLDMLDDLERVHRCNAENEEGFAYEIDDKTGALIIDLNDGRGRHKLSPVDLPKMIEINIEDLSNDYAFHKKEGLDYWTDQQGIDLFEQMQRDLESLNEKSLAESASLSGLRPLDIEKDFNSLLPAGMKKLGSEELKFLAEYSSLSQDELYYDGKAGKAFRLWSSDTYNFDLTEDRDLLHDSGAEDILETAIEEAKGDIKYCLDDGTPEGLKRAEKWKAFFEEKLGALRERFGECVRLSVPATIEVPFLPTSRSKKERTTYENVEFPVQIRVPKESEFPIAMRVTEWSPTASLSKEEWEKMSPDERRAFENSDKVTQYPVEELRAFEGRLYRPFKKEIQGYLKSSAYESDPSYLLDNYYINLKHGRWDDDAMEFDAGKSVVNKEKRENSLDEAKSAAYTEASKWLSFGGKLWRETGEPYFELSVSRDSAVLGINYVYEGMKIPFERPGRLFSAAHEKEAKETMEGLNPEIVKVGFEVGVEVLIPGYVRAKDSIDLEAEKVKEAEKTLEVIAKKAEPEVAPSSALEDFEKEMEALMAGTNKNPFLAARRILSNWKDERKDELNESFRKLGLDDGKKFVAYFEGKFGPDNAPRRLEKAAKERKNSDPEMGR